MGTLTISLHSYTQQTWHPCYKTLTTRFVNLLRVYSVKPHKAMSSLTGPPLFFLWLFVFVQHRATMSGDVSVFEKVLMSPTITYGSAEANLADTYLRSLVAFVEVLSGLS